jgi:hypothetical protein
MIKRMKSAGVAALFVLAAVAGVAAQGRGAGGGRRAEPDSAALRRDIAHLLSVMKIIEQEKNSLDLLIANFKSSAPQVPARVWDEMKKELRVEFTDEVIVETYAPIFARHFTHPEIKALLVFYESPLGRKYTDEIQLVRTEAFLEGVKLGEKIGERLRQKLKAKGYDLNISD